MLECYALGGGAEGQLRLLAAYLPALGFDLEVWSYKTPPESLPPAEMGGVRHRLLPGHGQGDLRFVLSLARELRASGCALLHTWMSSANTYGRLAGAVLARLPVISSERTSAKPARQRLVDRLLARLSSAIVVNSEGVRRFVVETEGITRERTVLIPNGIEVRRFQTVSSGQARLRLGLPDDNRPVLGTVGRHIPDKRQEWVLKAAAELQRRGHPVRAVIVGWGEGLPALRQLASDLGIAHHVVLTGVRPDVPEVLSALDLFLLPSRREGMPNVVMEALAAGVPVVATDVSGVRELMGGGPGPTACGEIVAVNDYPGFVQAAASLLTQGERLRAAAAAGRRRMAELFSGESMATAYARLYGRILGRTVP